MQMRCEAAAAMRMVAMPEDLRMRRRGDAAVPEHLRSAGQGPMRSTEDLRPWTAMPELRMMPRGVHAEAVWSGGHARAVARAAALTGGHARAVAWAVAWAPLH